jgi:hypothetical protein
MPWRFLLLSLAITTCAQPPNQEVEIGKLRVARAREAGAATYAADLLQQAEDALAEAQEALSHPDGYHQAVQSAATACIRADAARAQASEEKQRKHRRADRLLRECEALMEQARSMGEEGSRRQSLMSFSLRHESLRTMLEAGNVSEAHDGARQLKDELLGFLRSLN